VAVQIVGGVDGQIFGQIAGQTMGLQFGGPQVGCVVVHYQARFEGHRQPGDIIWCGIWGQKIGLNLMKDRSHRQINVMKVRMKDIGGVEVLGDFCDKLSTAAAGPVLQESKDLSKRAAWCEILAGQLMVGVWQREGVLQAQVLDTERRKSHFETFNADVFEPDNELKEEFGFVADLGPDLEFVTSGFLLPGHGDPDAGVALRLPRAQNVRVEKISLNIFER